MAPAEYSLPTPTHTTLIAAQPRIIYHFTKMFTNSFIRPLLQLHLIHAFQWGSDKDVFILYLLFGLIHDSDLFQTQNKPFFHEHL